MSIFPVHIGALGKGESLIVSLHEPLNGCGRVTLLVGKLVAGEEEHAQTSLVIAIQEAT